MKAISFGEILWDVFPAKGIRTIGGAPLNVAGHIRKLGGESAVISGIGNDELGRETRRIIQGLNVSDRFVVTVPGCGTGRADVSLKSGIPSYTFNYPAAWDMVRLGNAAEKELFAEEYDVFIYGTLAQRNYVSKEMLRKILSNIKAKEFFLDVNLRQHFYNDAILCESMQSATILKINDEELPIILKTCKCNDIKQIMEKYNLKIVILTCGKKGTYCYQQGENDIYAEPADVHVVDTVGAGDSLSAGFLYFYLTGNSVSDSLTKASLLADYVVQNNGAIPEYTTELKTVLGLL